MDNMDAQTGDFTGSTNDGNYGATPDTGDFHDTDGLDNSNTDLEQESQDELNSDSLSTTDDEMADGDEGAPEQPNPEGKTEGEEGKYYTQQQLNEMFSNRARREREAALKADPVRQYMEKRAAKFGMTPEQLIQEARRQEAEDETRQIAEANQVPEHIARQLQQQAAEQRERVEKQNETQMYREFMQEYPDVKPEEIDQETWYDVKIRGKSLSDAYAKQKLRETQAELERLRTGKTVQDANAKNRKTAPGKIKGSAPKSDFISKEDYEKLTLDDLLNPEVFARVERSQAKW